MSTLSLIVFVVCLVIGLIIGNTVIFVVKWVGIGVISIIKQIFGYNSKNTQQHSVDKPL